MLGLETLGRRYDLADAMDMAADEYSDPYDLMPSSNEVSWINISADVDAKEFFSWAASLGIVKDKSNKEYITNHAYLRCNWCILISVRHEEVSEL
jgi:hypothetical protein